ncbi:MAG TPA: plastocyanin/azurin family copper-binding protein [Nitrososphaera sp.]
MKRDLILLVGIISVFLVIGGVLIVTHSLPEEHARDFRPLSAGNLTLDSETIVIREPTPDDNTYIYAINDAAKEALYIAMNDTRIQQMLDQAKGKAVTVAAVQPTLLRTQSGESIHSSGGQVLIAVNWQVVDGKAYSDSADFASLEGKKGESHQQIWNVLVDMDTQQVTSISESRRTIEETLQRNLVYADMNMFMPATVTVDAGTTIRWFNDSNVPHNVVGSYRTKSGSTTTVVDSGFVERSRSWQYTFEEGGVFEYVCTIHIEEGMKGTIIVK